MISAAVEVMNEGSIDDDPPKPIHGHVADIQVPGNVLSLSEHMVRAQSFQDQELALPWSR